MKRLLPILLVAASAVCVGCKSGGTPPPAQDLNATTVKVTGDSMRYGLTCDGTTDSVLVLWPFGGDPVTYSTIDAKEDGHVIGKPQIGDWVAVIVSKEDTTEADFVINLDQLKGTWTYTVMPVMKDLQHMSRRMQRRMLAHVDDSIKTNYLVPREYGFTLKRSHVAQAVGHVMRSNTLADDSPVVYPEVRNYKQWYVLNGRLLLVAGDLALPGIDPKRRRPDTVDTLDFVSLDGDSLVLRQHNTIIGFHRKASTAAANKK